MWAMRLRWILPILFVLLVLATGFYFLRGGSKPNLAVIPPPLVNDRPVEQAARPEPRGVTPPAASAPPQEVSVPPPAPASAPPRLSHPASVRPDAAYPRFPWPPPAASSSYSLPAERFAGLKTFGQVADYLIGALEGRGYVERSFFVAANGGVVLVTRLERINQDGTSAKEPGRWGPPLGTEVGTVGGLASFLRGLFYAEPGFYRVLVFVIGGEAFSQSPRQVDEAEANQWLVTGMNRLPRELAQLPFDKEQGCSVLVYEFMSDAANSAARILSPGKLSAKSHLDKAGLFSAR